MHVKVNISLIHKDCRKKLKNHRHFIKYCDQEDNQKETQQLQY